MGNKQVKIFLYSVLSVTWSESILKSPIISTSALSFVIQGIIDLIRLKNVFNVVLLLLDLGGLQVLHNVSFPLRFPPSTSTKLAIP